MDRLWQLDSPVLFEKEKSEVLTAYPDLIFSIQAGIVFLRGSLPVWFEGKEIDRYSVEIELPKDYPNTVPIVRETGGRIPLERERHMNPESGTACLFIPEERYKAWPKGSSLLQFIDVPLRNFLIGQSLVELGETLPFGEFGHGEEGIREFYGEILGTSDLAAITKFLEYLVAKKIKGHWLCPCGSIKKLRDCHFEDAKALRENIDRHEMQNSLKRLLGMKTRLT